MVEGLTIAHRAEVAKLSMQLLSYRLELEKHGIEPPDRSSDDLLKMWRDCMAVVQHAHDFVIGLGSAKELIA